MTGYCMKCRASREMKDTKAIVMKNGTPATQGCAQSVVLRCSESGSHSSHPYRSIDKDSVLSEGIHRDIRN